MIRLLNELQLLKEHIMGLKHVLDKNEANKKVMTINRIADFALRKYAIVVTLHLNECPVCN